MEDDRDHMKHDNFYPSDFDDELNDLVGVEEFLQGVHEKSNTNIGSSTFQETYFLSSNGESDMDEEEDLEEILEPWEDLSVEDIEHMNIGTPTPHEFTSSSFEDISIETFLKYVHFTLQSEALMIDCIRGGYFPSFHQIHEANPSFCPLSNLHGRSTNNNMEIHTIERWKKIQGKLKVIQVFCNFVLYHLRYTKNRQIPPIEYWRSIVHNGHVDKNGKHLSISSTTNGIRTQWSTDINVGGMNSLFIQDCVNSCEVCQEKEIWDKVVTVPLEDLNASLDALCTKHIVLRKRYKCRV